MPKNYCIMQIWAESGKSALPICNYSQILYQFLTFTQNLKRSLNQIVGVLFGLTDYAYWLYVTDTEGNIDMSTTHDLKVMGL